MTVNPHGPGLQPITDLDGDIQVPGMHTGGESIKGIMRLPKHFLDILELCNGDDRPENLLLHDLHLLVDIGEDRGLDKVALLAVAAAPGLDLGTLVLARLDVVHDARELEFRDLRALDGAFLEGIADDVLFRAFGEFLDECVVDVFLDVDTGASAAALSCKLGCVSLERGSRGRRGMGTVVEVDSKVGPVDGGIEVSVVEDDGG